MSFLRTISTPRLMVLVAAVVGVAVAGTAIALAATGRGPVPPRKPLAVAVHDALAAPAVTGVTARIRFTNRLIDSADVQGSDPILTGASGRLWATAHRLRIELQSDQGDAQAVLDGRSFWIYDGRSNTVYSGRLPRERERRRGESGRVPSVARIERGIARIMRRTALSVAVPGDIAGQPAYTVRIGPKRNGGLVGAAELAWDAARGVPLRAAIFPRGSSSPVLELETTDIAYGPVPASDFAVSPPPRAKRVDLTPRSATTNVRRRRGRRLSGRTAVSRAVPFTLDAPRRLAGMRLSEVQLIGQGQSPGALVTYGRGLGGIAVIEHKVEGGRPGPLLGAQQAGDDSRQGLTLPTVSIAGSSGRELATALGTAIEFRRGGVDYTVVGSVSAATARAAARGL